jgi:hypothetical protein
VSGFLHQHLMRRLEGVQPGRDAGIGGGVDQRRLNLGNRYAVVQRAFNMQLQLPGMPGRGQHRQIEKAAGLAVQRRVTPGPAPRPGGGGALEGHHKRVGVFHRCIDIVRPQHGAADRQPFIE